MKKRLAILMLIMLIMLSIVTLFACSEGISPVESIVITKYPKTEYFRGDLFALNGAEMVLYYENGTTKLVPLTLEMISDFNSSEAGEQILTIRHEGATAFLKVVVTEAPITRISVVNDNYKKTYVQGQALAVEYMKL